MNICDATRLALATGTRMARKPGREFMPTYIKPTNDPVDCCIIETDFTPPGKRWNPTAEDLMALDWAVEGYRVKFPPKAKRGNLMVKFLFKLLLLLIGKKRYGGFNAAVRFDGKIYELTIDEFILRLYEPENELSETESSR